MFAGAEVKLPESYTPKQKLEAITVQFSNVQSSRFIEDAGWKRYRKSDKLGALDVIDVPMPYRRTFTSSVYTQRNVPSSVRLSVILRQIPYIDEDYDYWDKLLDVALDVEAGGDDV